jgi:septum formation protein
MLILCSGSKSRALLLREFGIDFVQRPVDFNEDTIDASDARSFVYQASKGKLEAAKAAFGLDVPLLTADSVIVTREGEILRKPDNQAKAEELLRKQSGSEIAIVTCVHYACNDYTFVDLSATHYSFAPFDEEDLQRYLQSGQWRGKAGGCMVEGFCKPYIRHVRGLESTARGLQVEILKPWLCST